MYTYIIYTYYRDTNYILLEKLILIYFCKNKKIFIFDILIDLNFL